jgi:hypothetical protein
MGPGPKAGPNEPGTDIGMGTLEMYGQVLSGLWCIFAMAHMAMAYNIGNGPFGQGSLWARPTWAMAYMGHCA